MAPRAYGIIEKKAKSYSIMNCARQLCQISPLPPMVDLPNWAGPPVPLTRSREGLAWLDMLFRTMGFSAPYTGIPIGWTRVDARRPAVAGAAGLGQTPRL